MGLIENFFVRVTMSPSDLLVEIGQKETDRGEVADRVIRNPELHKEESRKIPEEVGVIFSQVSGRYC